MSVIILGAGVIGSTLAYYLAKGGEKVIVLERQANVALETSFANAGQISYGYASPWAAPGVPLKAVQWLLQSHPPLAVKPDGSLFQLEWIIRFLSNCRKSKYAINKERMLRLAEYSKSCLASLRNEENIIYDGNSLGTLQLFRTEKQLQAILDKDIPVLEANNVPHNMLIGKEVTQAEPALAHVQHKIVGGLHLPQDETGDCFMFTNSIVEKAKSLGAEFIFNSNVEKLLVKYQNGRKQVYGVSVNGQEMLGDNIVVALGSYSRTLLDGLVNLPVYPVKGYSITADISDESMAPQSTILDETYKIALTRLNKRIRVGGMAHISGFDKHLDANKVDTLNFVLQDLFPKAYVESKGGWTGLRPATPDGTPIVGNTQINNLWLSTGHGTLGWTMACGSGRLLSDLILGKSPEIQAHDLSINRYS
jgi:D-amino-acid dehydrogenase